VIDGHRLTAEARFLALGDSYTMGEAVEADERWPVRLTSLLRARGMAMGDPEIVARTGWTTDELSDAIDAASPRGPYDLVSLLIGVNNQYRGRSAADYREQFRALLTRAIGFAGDRSNRVIVLSIPDWGVTPFAANGDPARIGREIDEFNSVSHDESRRAGSHYVDVTTISRRAAREPNLLAGDGLHPSAVMYEEWAQVVLPVAVSAVNGSGF
jgi:lysophospholipase L1-like esterase